MPKAREREIEEDRTTVAGESSTEGNEIGESFAEADEGFGADFAAPTKPVKQESREKIVNDFGEEDAADLEDDPSLAYSEDEDYNQRLSRRQKRNRARRERAAQSEQQIVALSQELNRLRGVVDQLGIRQVGLAAGDIDSQMAQLQSQIEQITDAMANAVEHSDKETWRRGQQLRDEATQRLTMLGLERRRLEAIARSTPRPDDTAPTARTDDTARPVLDPKTQHYSEIFMERHPWFDPEDVADEESNMVKAIDQALFNQGYLPNTKQYWVELESRVKKLGLGSEFDGDDEMNDDRELQPVRRNSGGLPGRTARGGANPNRPRKPGLNTLPRFASETLEELGLVGDNLTKEQVAQRDKYLKTWSTGLKNLDERRR